MKRFILAGTATALLAVVGAGCAGGGSASPSDVGRDWVTAVLAGNGERACDLMTGESKREFAVAGALLGGEGCEGTLSKLRDLGDGDGSNLPTEAEIKVKWERVKGNTAKVKFESVEGGDKDNEPLHLRKVDGDWLVNETDA